MLMSSPSSAPAMPVQRGLLPDLIAEQARRTPTVPAVVDGEVLRYSELLARADDLAARLAGVGAGPDTPIGICLPRSAGMIVAVLAALRAGSPYVPLDPSYPAGRLTLMAADAGVTLAVADKRSRTRLPAGVETLTLPSEAGRAAPDSTITADTLAYIIYTSGSTGTPRGVEVTHGNLAASTAARLEVYGRTPERFLLLSSLSFDSSAAGIFWTLSTGGTLVLATAEEQRDPDRLAALIASEGITHLLAVPSLYRLLLDHAAPAQLASLRTVIVAGERCPTSLVATHQRLLPGCGLFNEYGPTEATVWATVYDATTHDPAHPVPIGRPIPGVDVVLLDEAGHLAAPNETGEIYIGGPGVARGYRNRPELTAERFPIVSLNGRPPARLYRSGDLAVRRPDGLLAFAGRTDGQLKIHGYRIEPGEIEAALDRIPGVAEAVVVLQPAGQEEPRLVAYLVPASPALSLAEVRAHLTEQLPAHLVPAAFRLAAELPRTPNGKVDRQALAGTVNAAVRFDRQTGSALEERLGRIMADVLGLESVGREDDFFHHGGTSLLAIRLASRLREVWGPSLPLNIVFAQPTPAALADAITACLTAWVASLSDDEVQERLAALTAGA